MCAVAAAAIPLGVGGLAIGLALGAAALVARAWPLSIALQNVVSMLGLGLGVDYTLLLVSRFREARAAGGDAEHAAVEAATYAGHSVLVSAATVAVGFAALLAVPLADLRSIAAGGLLVVVVSALLAVTLVPGLLAALGERIEIGRVLPRAHGAGASRWRGWATRVARHPVRTLAIAGLPLVLLAAQATRLKPQLPRGDWLPRSAEAARGARTLLAMGSGGVVQTLRLVVVLVFQDGHGARLLGLPGPLDGTFAAVPLLVFCIVFGLSMDYEVFLLSRVAEARRRGASEGAALVSGVGRSGRVITSAASIMIVVFGAFALGDFVLVKILGVALATAVVLDATLVRLAVGPALLALAGRWNWWPGSRVPNRTGRATVDTGRRVRAAPTPSHPPVASPAASE